MVVKIYLLLSGRYLRWRLRYFSPVGQQLEDYTSAVLLLAEIGRNH
jgi:hypothetical protein